MRIALAGLWFLLAGWFLLGSSTGRDAVLGELQRAARVDPEAISSEPSRTPLTDPPRILLGGVEQRCSDCHDLFSSREPTPATLRQHREVVLDHGLNDRCYNCHSNPERTTLVLRDGTEVPFGESTSLCAQCHGTVFRDWERGMHGKTLGSWDPASPEFVRLECVSCHDPHAPAFEAIVPLPGPASRHAQPRSGSER
jgi:hypothetical protein